MAKLDVVRMSAAARESLQARELPDEVDREQLADYLGGLCAAIGSALARWQGQAMLRDVRVDGARASGGRVVGPEVEGLIRGAAPTGWLVYTHPVSSGIRDQVRRFERDLRVPNLVWYPALAHVFAAQAAPTLNLPSPLAALAVVESGDPQQLADTRLRAMLSFTRTLILNPIAGDRALLNTLPAAGISTPAIVSLAQLIAFLSYQTRLVAGLAAMRAARALAHPEATR